MKNINSMRLITKSGMCVVRKCPSLYEDKDGSFYVQGYVVKNAKKKLPSLPAGEALVRIDASLVRMIKKSSVVC